MQFLFYCCTEALFYPILCKVLVLRDGRRWVCVRPVMAGVRCWWYIDVACWGTASLPGTRCMRASRQMVDLEEVHRGAGAIRCLLRVAKNKHEPLQSRRSIHQLYKIKRPAHYFHIVFLPWVLLKSIWFGNDIFNLCVFGNIFKSQPKWDAD